MLGSIGHGGDTTGTGDHRIDWPETGCVRVLLELLLAYHLLTVATPVLLDQFRILNPAVVPEPATTALYALFFIGSGAVVARLVRSGSFVAVRRFDDGRAAERYMDRDLSARRRLLTDGGLTVAGAALAGLAHARFVDAFRRAVDLLVVVGGFDWPFTAVDGIVAVGFLMGFALFAVGIDRLVVAGLRRYVRRQHDAG